LYFLAEIIVPVEKEERYKRPGWVRSNIPSESPPNFSKSSIAFSSNVSPPPSKPTLFAEPFLHNFGFGPLIDIIAHP